MARMIGIALTALALQQAPRAVRFEREFAFYPGGKVQLHAGALGTLKVSGWKRPAVRIEAETVLDLGTGAQDTAARPIPIEVRHGPTLATITVPATAGATGAIHTVLWVPAPKTDLDLRMTKGDLAVSGVNGWIEVMLGDGRLEATSIQGYFSALLRRGDIVIELAGKRWVGHSLSAATERGRIELRVPRDFSGTIDLRTRDGRLEIDYPDQIVDGEKVPLAAFADRRGGTLLARLGDGGAPVRLSSGAGDVRLTTAGIRAE